MELVRQVDKLMLNVVNTKFNWNSIEEIVQVTNVYLTMYQIRYYPTRLTFIREINLYIKGTEGRTEGSGRHRHQSFEDKYCLAPG